MSHRDPKVRLAGIVIPAHNEERTIGRLLRALVPDIDNQLFDVVVACNGCTDQTAAVAASFAPSITVVEIPNPSKRTAMERGDAVLPTLPRVYIDADVEIDAESVTRLIAPLRAGTALASAPTRRVPRQEASRMVRWYYDVWEQLPQVRSGLFGRGVIALSEAGRDRVKILPHFMSDDLVISEAFSEVERVVVEDAVVTVRPPKTTNDLIRRRIRVATGNAQAGQAGAVSDSAKTSISTLVAIARHRPALAAKIVVFLVVTVVARIGARRAIRGRDYTTWRRDDSSRD